MTITETPPNALEGEGRGEGEPSFKRVRTNIGKHASDLVEKVGPSHHMLINISIGQLLSTVEPINQNT